MKTILLFFALLIPFCANAQSDLMNGRTATQTKTFLSLNNVENTALSTWAGTTNITTLGTISSGTWNGSIVTSAYGGTGNGFTKFTGPSASEKTFTLPNASATILTDNAAVTVAQGGTGAASFTAYSVVCAGTTSTGAFQNVSGLGTSGYVLTSNGAGALPSWQSPSGGYTYSTITADQSAAVNNSYVNNKASTRCVVTLPSTASVGQRIQVLGFASNGWKIAQNAGQTIRWSGTSSTSGTSGYAQSNSQYDMIELVCIVTNTDWEVIGAQGQITIN